MADFKYPIRCRWTYSGEIVEFTSLSEGTVVDPGRSGKRVGYHATTFAPHTSSGWELLKRPISHRLHEAVPQFKDLP